MQFHDYYRTLGVERSADQDQIRKAFRKLARQYHPDLSKAPDAEAKMQEINEAYAVLSDPEKRAAYDQLGSGFQAGQDFRPPPDWGRQGGFRFSESDIGGADFSDFFSELFGRMGSGNGFGGRTPSQGRDHHVKIELDLEDAFTAPSRQLTLRMPQLDAQGRVQTGARTLNLKIPRGVCEGQMIRLAGQGSPGPGGAPAGDLLLEVHFKPHPEFRIDGRDLHKTLALAPWEAALGAVIEVKLPDGAVKVRIPEGAQSGQQLRVRGKGIPGAKPGDLLLELAVKLPPADTPQARQLYQTMARELAFDPRR